MQRFQSGGRRTDKTVVIWSTVVIFLRMQGASEGSRGGRSVQDSGDSDGKAKIAHVFRYRAGTATAQSSTTNAGRKVEIWGKGPSEDGSRLTRVKEAGWHTHLTLQPPLTTPRRARSGLLAQSAIGRFG